MSDLKTKQTLSLQVAKILGTAIVLPSGTKESSPVPYAFDDYSALLHLHPWIRKHLTPETWIEIIDQTGVHDPPWLVECYIGNGATWITGRAKTLAEALCCAVVKIDERLKERIKRDG